MRFGAEVGISVTWSGGHADNTGLTLVGSFGRRLE